MKISYNLRPLWLAEIEIYKHIERICKKHNLRFYAGFGTALGAVRHKGFIPWDDDIDILMPRPDYEKFWDYAKIELPSQFQAVTYKMDQTFFQRFGKVRETRDDVIENLRNTTLLPLEDGVWIDIFPMDGSPKSGLSNFLWRLKMAIYKAALWGYSPPPPKNVRLFFRMKYWF